MRGGIATTAPADVTVRVCVPAGAMVMVVRGYHWK
jgi:hypothetical protein